MEEKPFSEFKNNVQSYSKYYIGIDIGGTNTRVIAGFDEGDIYHVHKFQANTICELLKGLQEAAAMIAQVYNHPPEICCIDIAGPTTDNKEYDITNYNREKKEFHVLTKCDLPVSICPPSRTHIINDLESGCYGLVHLISSKAEQRFFKPVITSDGPKCEGSQVIVVLAAGTGLGVGLIHHLKHKDKYNVIPSELGHINVSSYGPNHPHYQCELDLFNKVIPTHDPKRQYALEYEDIVSGRGLVACYNAYKAEGDKSLTGAEIAQIAMEDPLKVNPSTKAMLAHYRYLIRAAQELSVGMRATTTYLIGDNVVKNSKFVDAVQDELVKEFFAHTKEAWLKKISNLHVQSELANLNLYGTLYFARNASKE
ncbi:hypothetical protein SAMD00019534_109610 [Acytostelium subglobosum LB1]|uniref:hypothetical protein n=1 Tax=Acytostelium subglobosum LB1 TaxID=1410327 RepID=UPI000644A9C0|nr:hypothetical protein SAMD00019534_109610 [Acytostelium subglobosum LB1]GAM27785.1 hypothetical protein SAMD00019534_109610 [Acytostelium subglobosum LB1]|eukprot:XP_012749444.1 hypothetical protein SAMD00019534_109610 [Acytostelium subglobosum LB1]